MYDATSSHPQSMIYPLLPIAIAYDAVTSIRNLLYDHGILASQAYDLPVICIGNLAVGGTGKTPHTEYLVRLLQANGYHVAVLSRGYKRKTKGFVMATECSTAADIGDESLQLARKFPDLVVAVDEDRCDGIQRLVTGTATAGIDVILLDDAFQHRRVAAGLNILLTDSHRLYTRDYLLPAGRLRENRRGGRRADIVVVTKLDQELNDHDAYRYYEALDIRSNQDIYFTRFRYGNLYNKYKEIALADLEQYNVLLVTGIANPRPLERELSKYTQFSIMRYADHHAFSDNDYTMMQREYEALGTDKPRIVVTTEKDMARLQPDGMAFGKEIYALPIEVEVLHNEKDMFNQQILDYVRTNSRNRTIPQAEDDKQA